MGPRKQRKGGNKVVKSSGKKVASKLDSPNKVNSGNEEEEAEEKEKEEKNEEEKTQDEAPKSIPVNMMMQMMPMMQMMMPPTTSDSSPKVGGDEDQPKRKRGRPSKKEAAAAVGFPMWPFGFPMMGPAAQQQQQDGTDSPSKKLGKKKPKSTGNPRGRPRTRARPGEAIKRAKPPVLAPASYSNLIYGMPMMQTVMPKTEEEKKSNSIGEEESSKAD